ncbi:MAG TPA: hypothetical protein VJ867_03635 [Gemmatimonadaceae bacterium]|nr:hypothetical protein [Gemmatimonadaceae bacterium]
MKVFPRVRRYRVRWAGVVLLAGAAAACHRHGGTLPSRPVSTEGAEFIGIISDVRSMMIIAREESLTKTRRGEIWISPATEITNRTGMLVPLETIRRGMHVIVWFTNDFSETSTVVEGRASRVVVDY